MYETTRYERSSSLAAATRVATIIWIVATAVNLAIWFTVCTATLSLDKPWWLWVFTSGGITVAGLRFAEHVCGDGR